jgi:hypothetical protein
LADRTGSVSIPEEAIELAREVAMRTGSTKASVEAAAPLIVAAAYERLAKSIDYDRYRSRTSTGGATAVDLVREDILAQASVLRGEGQQ